MFRTSARIILCGMVVMTMSGCKNGHTRSSYAVKRVVLLDVQGLWGGRNLYVNAKGQGWQQDVKPGKAGLQEHVYEFVLTKGTLDRFGEILAQHDFFNIRIKDRFGVPDEARPTIYVETVDGRSGYVSMWSGDHNDDFTAIYEVLLKWAKSNTEQASSRVAARDFDWDWRPPGFEDVKP